MTFVQFSEAGVPLRSASKQSPDLTHILIKESKNSTLE